MKKRYLIIPAILLLLFFLLFSLGFVGLDFKSYGHGDISRGSGTSFLTALNILHNYDYTDDSGEGYCYNEDCWEEADREYDECCGEVVYSIKQMGIFYIGGGFDFGECPIECENEYEEKLMNECSERCETETYIWDGTPLTNLGEFSRNAYPNFMDKSETFCSSWLIGGTWYEESNKVGCEDAFLIYCDSRSLESARDVCEAIGKSWTCDFSQATCSE